MKRVYEWYGVARKGELLSSQVFDAKRDAISMASFLNQEARKGGGENEHVPVRISILVEEEIPSG